MRIAIFSHGHPEFSKGGAELASHSMFKALRSHAAHSAWYIARADQRLLHPGTHVAIAGNNEYLISGQSDAMDLSATIPLSERSDFVTMLQGLDPDVLHFHHYYLIGLETMRVARRACPRAKLILTLHDYMAICARMGQMVKTTGQLCYRAGPRECAMCFPEKSAEDMFLRERYVRQHFELVDAFVSPSRFLASRYAEWGVPAQKIHVIENGFERVARLPQRPLPPGGSRNRFAFFGQINPFKGVDLLLEAFLLLPRSVRQRASLDIFGSALENQKKSYRKRVKELLDETSGRVRLRGEYERRQLGRMMSEIDWVVMGSRWWENSPLVIQEAHSFGRPVICPDIGGMAEKVIDGEGGFHYRAGDPVALASLMETLVEDPSIHDMLYARLPVVADASACVESHIDLYHQLGAGRERGACG